MYKIDYELRRKAELRAEYRAEKEALERASERAAIKAVVADLVSVTQRVHPAVWAGLKTIPAQMAGLVQTLATRRAGRLVADSVRYPEGDCVEVRPDLNAIHVLAGGYPAEAFLTPERASGNTVSGHAWAVTVAPNGAPLVTVRGAHPASHFVREVVAACKAANIPVDYLDADVQMDEAPAGAEDGDDLPVRAPMRAR